MAGFPGLLRRLSFGPIRKDRNKIKNPEEEVSAAQMNLLFWQVAGMNGLVPKAFFTIESISSIEVGRKWLAWDPDNLLPNSVITVGTTGTGQYSWAFGASSYADKDGQLVPIVFDIGQGATSLVDVIASVGISASGYEGTVSCRSITDGSAIDVGRVGVWLYGP